VVKLLARKMEAGGDEVTSPEAVLRLDLLRRLLRSDIVATL
jgi:hypothetical protein